jgi:hypothetical protein
MAAFMARRLVWSATSEMRTAISDIREPASWVLATPAEASTRVR